MIRLSFYDDILYIDKNYKYNFDQTVDEIILRNIQEGHYNTMGSFEILQYKNM